VTSSSVDRLTPIQHGRKPAFYSLGTLTAPNSGRTRTAPTAEQVRDLLKAHRKLVPSNRAELVFRGGAVEVLATLALRRRYKKAL